MPQPGQCLEGAWPISPVSTSPRQQFTSPSLIRMQPAPVTATPFTTSPVSSPEQRPLRAAEVFASPLSASTHTVDPEQDLSKEFSDGVEHLHNSLGFSEAYGVQDNSAHNYEGQGVLQKPCSVLVIDYGIKKDGTYACFCNGVQLRHGMLQDRITCKSRTDLMEGLPDGFFVFDNSWERRVRWIDVEGKNGDITEFCMLLLRCADQSIFNMIVDPKQNSMVFDLDFDNPGTTLLLMAMKSTLSGDAVKLERTSERFLFGLSDVELEKTVVYLCNVGKDRKQGSLITLQEGLRDDVFAPVVADITARKRSMCDQDVAHLILRLIRASSDSLWAVLNFVDRAIEELEQELCKCPGDLSLFEAARLFESECTSLVTKSSPFEITLHDLTNDFDKLLGSTRLSFKALSVQNRGMLQRLQHRSLHSTALVNMYKDNLHERMEWNQKIVGIVLFVFSPLSFVAGVYGMNFTKPDGTPAMWELALGYTKAPDGSVVRTGLIGYELFWLVVFSITVIVLLGYATAEVSMKHTTHLPRIACCKKRSVRRPSAFRKVSGPRLNAAKTWSGMGNMGISSTTTSRNV